jgi:cold shock CspA family protein
MNGIVSRYSDSHGFGFIDALVGEPGKTEDIFFHCSAIRRLPDGRRQAIPVGAEVRFRLVRGHGKRRVQAADVDMVVLDAKSLVRRDDDTAQ